MRILAGVLVQPQGLITVAALCVVYLCSLSVAVVPAYFQANRSVTLDQRRMQERTCFCYALQSLALPRNNAGEQHPRMLDARRSSRGLSDCHHLGPSFDNSSQSISPQVQRFPLLAVIGVLHVHAQRHPGLGRGAMVGDVP